MSKSEAGKRRVLSLLDTLDAISPVLAVRSAARVITTLERDLSEVMRGRRALKRDA